MRYVKIGFILKVSNILDGRIDVREFLLLVFLERVGWLEFFLNYENRYFVFSRTCFLDFRFGFGNFVFESLNLCKLIRILGVYSVIYYLRGGEYFGRVWVWGGI